jgi:hypothetical protein
MTDHNHDHAERVESLTLRLRLAHDAGDRNALTEALGAAVRCPGCVGDLVLILLDMSGRLDFVDRILLNDRLCDLHPPDEIDAAGVAALFEELSVSDELELFGLDGLPD